MSDMTPPERDDTGRFVSAKQEDPVSDDREAWHPLARSLFGWTVSPKLSGMLFWGSLIVGALLILVDVLVEHHPYFHVAGSFGFHGFFGFAAFAFVVLMGWPLGRLLRRDENYYGDAETAEERKAREDT